MTGRVLIEPVAEAASLSASVTEQEWRQAMTFTCRRRRNEYLSWRAAVRRELGREVKIDYDEAGAPRVDIPDIYISVSHARGMIAVAIADCRCGIDIESLDRRFEHVADRYMSLRERELSSDPEWPAVVWCAKEAMYKLCGRRGVSLRDDLVVESCDRSRQTLCCRIVGVGRCTIYIKKIKDYIVASSV